MDLRGCLLLRSRSDSFVGNVGPCGLPRNNVAQSLKSFKRCGALCASVARGSFGEGVLQKFPGFSSGLLSLERLSLTVDCKRGIRESSLISHRSRRDGITVAAMSASRDADEGAQLPRDTRTEAATLESRYPRLLVERTVSSGETIRYPGSVMVFGDVQEGGKIIADGDIVVLGRLQGDVHGGQNGDRDATVCAVELDDCHIRIAEAIALGSKSQILGCPVIVYVQKDGTLGARVLFGDVGTHWGSPHRESTDIKKARTSSELQSAGVTESVKTSEGSESKDQAASKRPAQLALFTGVYISLVGMALLVFPTSLFGVLFDVRSVTVGWIRVGAILAVVFGVYYIGTAVGDMRGISGAWAFYMSTVVGRVFLFVGFCWLVATGAAQRALLLIGIVNMLGAMSMLAALRQDSKTRVLNT